MSWQKCPKCDGSGSVEDAVLFIRGTCYVCNGGGVINEQTGEPLYTITTGTTITIKGEE